MDIGLAAIAMKGGRATVVTHGLRVAVGLLLSAPLSVVVADPKPLFSPWTVPDDVTHTAATLAEGDAGKSILRPKAARTGPSLVDRTSHPATLRHRMARLDLGQLNALRESGSKTPVALHLNLFGDADFRLVSPRFAPTSAGYSLSGDLAGLALGTATIVVSGEIVVGSVHTAQTSFTIRSVGKGVSVRITELGPGAVQFEEPEELRVGQPRVSKRSGVATDALSTESDEVTPIDLLVVWSPEAQYEAESSETMVATIDHLVAYTNKVFGDSGALVRLNVSHMQMVDTEDDGGLNVWHMLHGRETALDDRNVREVVMDLRDRAGADLVHFVASGYPCAGIANILTTADGSENRAFSMAKYTCASNVFAHEVGHNFGLYHDRYLDAGKSRIGAYSHGYVNQAAFEPDAPASAFWRTIMAYDDQCSELQRRCPWISRFSNPDHTHLGDPLGVPGETETHSTDGPANARRTINETRFAIAGYRDPRPNLSVSVTIGETALDRAERFSLTADIANGGGAASVATTLVVYQSGDSELSDDDTEAGRVRLDAVDPSGTRAVSLDVTGPQTPGTYHYIACVEDAVAVVPCDAVGVTVGPTVSVSAAEAFEGQTIRFPVSISSAFPVDVGVTYAVSGNTAVDGIDFVMSAGTVTIASGETQAWIEVETVDDAAAEPRDALSVALSGVSPDAPEGPVVSADGGIAAGTIVDDDGDFTIADPRLRAGVLQALGRADDGPVTVADMATLRELSASGTTDLTGLEFATGLRQLELSSTTSSLVPLGHLPSLRVLIMPHWRGSDLEAVGGLKTLRILEMPFAAVQDVSPLAGLVGLRYLNLRGDFWSDGCARRGSVSDLSPLSGLVELRELHFDCNHVRDLSAVSGMTELRQLSVRGNDVSSLVGLEHLPSLWLLALDSNPIADLSPISGLTDLLKLTLNGASVTDLSPLGSLTKMISLQLGHNGAISNISALRSMSLCGALDLSGNDISDLSPLQDLGALRSLDLGQNRIFELQPLANLSLRSLTLDGNRIEDVSALRDMSFLTELSLRSNVIENVTPLAEIDTLTHLWLDGNAISDISPLAKLTGLRHLSLGRNAIVDISALADLSELTELDLSDNFVSDIVPLAGLTRLGHLQMGNNLVKDVSALVGNSQLPALRSFYLYGNPLTEATLAAHIPRLREAGVSVYRAVALALDASAREGDDMEAVVRLTEAATQGVRLTWGVVGARARRIRSVIDVEATTSEDDFDGDGACSAGHLQACRDIHIPPGTMEADTFLRVWDDHRAEPHEVFIIELSGSTLHPEVSLPYKRPHWLGVRISQAVGLLVDPAGRSHTAPLFPTAGDDLNQGFVRVVNLGGRSAVHVEAFQPDGSRSTTTLSIRPGEARHFNSDELEDGSFGKGLSRGVGRIGGDWRLRLWSNEILALSYIRTTDGFLTSMHDVVVEDPVGIYRVPIFNPGSDGDQVSQLRLVNQSDADANVEISGMDDDGAEGGVVRLSLAAGASRTITARELESGEGLDGSLGDGQGKWRLTVGSDVSLAVANLLQGPAGHLTNLSTVPANRTSADGETTHHVPYFPAAADANGRQGFVRVVNRGADEAAVRIVAYDDEGPGYSTSLGVPGGAAVHFNSNDLELGDADRDLTGIGAGTGDWRLEIESDTELDVLAYVRHGDGFLTSMHDVVVGTPDHRYDVLMFNPGSNRNQVSSLLVANSTTEDANVTITGVDDRGITHGEVGLVVPARRTVTVSAEELETGGETTTGRLGDGSGKWRLNVASDRPLWVMSLLESRPGYLTNLSSVPQTHQR